MIAAVSIALAFYIAGFVTKPLIASAESLRHISQNLESAVAAVNDSAATVAENSNEQAAATEQTSATLNETSRDIDKTAENMRVAAKLAQEFKQNAANGKEKIERLVSTMHELSESSGAIGKIAKAIDGIAFQTNLLAINATVEAARAGGDAGRSFGVVAEEVRNLSQKSAKSAAEATQIISHDIALVDTNEKISMEVAAALGEITDEFEKLDAIIHEVDESTEHESDGIKQISAAMTQIERSTQTNAATSEESAASAAILRELVGDLEKVYFSVSAVVYGGKSSG